MPVEFGLAVENFTPASRRPSGERILAYAAAATVAESLGYRSLWVWDHLFLGKRRPFPFLEALSTLAALATRTSTVTLGTGVLVLPLRNPVVLAKVAATVDLLSGGRLSLGVAAGWYEREFQACGVPFQARGRLFERNLEILTRLWTEDSVDHDGPPGPQPGDPQDEKVRRPLAAGHTGKGVVWLVAVGVAGHGRKRPPLRNLGRQA